MTINLEKEFGALLDLIVERIDDISDDQLKHYGVLGMKWGVRKDRAPVPTEMVGLGPDSVTRTTKNGEEITISKDPPHAIAKFLGKMSKRVVKNYNDGAFLTIKDSKGKSVGEATVEKRSNDELYLNWLGIDKSARGKGYATAVMEAAAEFGKQSGFERMTLEVPGNAPDALHIYEKLGFVITKQAESTDDIWGGLTEMVYEFDNQNAMSEADALKHYGVLGMKWGVRKPEPSKAAMTKARRNNKERRAKAAKTGATTGLAIGAVGGQLAIEGAVQLLRSPEFNNFMVQRAVQSLPPEIQGLGRLMVMDRVFKNNEMQAVLLGHPKFRALAGAGIAFMGSVVGGAVGNLTVDRATLKEARENDG